MAEPVRLLCPQCRTAYRLKVAVRPGATVKCSKCGADMVVPQPPSAPPIAGKSEFAGSSDDRHVSLAADREAPTLALPEGDSEEGVETVLKEADPNAGRYIEQAVIGRGGMGEVALCIDRNTRRQVALKRILPEAAQNPGSRARFVEEAQVTAQLEHPNIVPVHELDRTPDGTIYFTMKLVKGRSLAEIIREMKEGELGKPPLGKGGFPQAPSPKPLGLATQKSLERGLGENLSSERLSPSSLSDLLQVFLKVCDGVAFAHSRGVIHRDLKAANIMVGDYGEVLVMDWGLAKLVGAADQRDEGRGTGDPKEASPRATVGLSDRALPAVGTGAEEKTRLDKPAVAQERVVTDRHDDGLSPTLDGSTLGTPAYMSPEQANGELDKIDPRSDIYSLGAILYEILTLERAVEGETPMMVLANAARNRIVPIEKRAAARRIPRELAAIAMKCLAKTRAARYRSVLGLRRDVALFLEGRSVSAAPDSSAQAIVKLVKRNKGISAAVAAAAMVLVAVTIGFLVSLKGQRDRARASEGVAVKERKAAQEARDNQRATALSASERFAKQAVLAAEYYRWEEAEQRAADSAAVCPDGPWALFAQGRFAQIRKEHGKAVEILQRAQEVDPKNSEVTAALKASQAFLKDIENAEKIAAGGSVPGDWEALEKLAETLVSGGRWRQAKKVFLGAIRLVERATNIPPEAKASILEGLTFRLGEEKAWVACEGFYDSIKHLPPEEQVKRVEAKLTEVNGQPIRFVSVQTKEGKWTGAILDERPIKYLSPLNVPPLASLSCQGTQVRDLSPLKGMPLTDLNCRLTTVSDLGPLKGMALTNLNCGDTKVSDLNPLKGMPLTEFHCTATSVSDLNPLKGMPLRSLECWGTSVSDLSPIKGMPLVSVCCEQTNVTDLNALEGMELFEFSFTPKAITRGIEIVRGMKSIKKLGIKGGWNKWMSREEFWKRYDAGEFK